MTEIIRKIEKLARKQGVTFKPHSSYYFGTLDLGDYIVTIGDKGDVVEFTAEVSPDFSSRSLAGLPSTLSSLLLRRNQDALFVRWAIEFGSDSREYFYCCRIALPHSEITEEAFRAIEDSLYMECKFYDEVVSTYS